MKSSFFSWHRSFLLSLLDDFCFVGVLANKQEEKLKRMIFCVCSPFRRIIVDSHYNFFSRGFRFPRDLHLSETESQDQETTNQSSSISINSVGQNRRFQSPSSSNNYWQFHHSICCCFFVFLPPRNLSHLLFVHPFIHQQHETEYCRLLSLKVIHHLNR